MTSTTHSTSEAGAVSSKTAPQFTGRVLIVDNDSLNRITMSSLLQLFGLECTAYEDGTEVVEAYRSWRMAADLSTPGLIIMDQQMPLMNGGEATALIRQTEASEGWPPIPIIGLTGHLESDFRARFEASGITQWCSKPIRMNTWMELLQRYAGPAPAG